jgi:hypothetical protein
MAAYNGLCPPAFAKDNRMVADTSIGGKIRYGKKKNV